MKTSDSSFVRNFFSVFFPLCMVALAPHIWKVKGIVQIPSPYSVDYTIGALVVGWNVVYALTTLVSGRTNLHK